MKLEYFIIGLLKQAPRTGYEIKALLDAEGRFVRQHTPLSQIYTTLKHMREDGWVEFEENWREGKPALKIYSVTPTGDKAFREWLSAPHEPSFSFLDKDFFGKLLFSFLIDKQTVLKHCYTELNYRKEQIAEFRGRDRTVKIAPQSDVSPACAQLLADSLHEYGAEAVDHYVAWLERFIQKLETLSDEEW